MRLSTAFPILLYLTLGFLALGHVIRTNELEQGQPRETILHPNQRPSKRADVDVNAAPIRTQMFDLKTDPNTAKKLSNLLETNRNTDVVVRENGIMIYVIADTKVYEVAIKEEFFHGQSVQDLKNTPAYNTFENVVFGGITKLEKAGNWLCGDIDVIISTRLPSAQRTPAHRAWVTAISGDFKERFKTELKAKPLLVGVLESRRRPPVRLRRLDDQRLDFLYGEVSLCRLNFASTLNKPNVNIPVPAKQSNDFYLLNDEGQPFIFRGGEWR